MPRAISSRLAMSSIDGTPKAATPRSIRRAPEALSPCLRSQKRPGSRGVFIVAALGFEANLSSAPGSAPANYEGLTGICPKSPNLLSLRWNQYRSSVFTDVGWGSISLILLHHPLFQL